MRCRLLPSGATAAHQHWRHCHGGTAAARGSGVNGSVEGTGKPLARQSGEVWRETAGLNSPGIVKPCPPFAPRPCFPFSLPALSPLHHVLPLLLLLLQLRFECADALLNSHAALIAVDARQQMRLQLLPLEQLGAAEEAATAAEGLLRLRCLQLLHRASLAMPLLGPAGITCHAAEVSWTGAFVMAET